MEHALVTCLQRCLPAARRAEQASFVTKQPAAIPWNAFADSNLAALPRSDSVTIASTRADSPKGEQPSVVWPGTPDARVRVDTDGTTNISASGRDALIRARSLNPDSAGAAL
eukprot:6870802-Prymnesium_polylepis.2